MNRFTLSHDSETCSSSPEISSTAFRAQPPNLRFASLIDMGFAIIGRSPDAHASDPVLVHWLALLLHASRRPCVSLSLHHYQVVKRTFTSKLSNMLGVPKQRSRPCGRPLMFSTLQHASKVKG